MEKKFVVNPWDVRGEVDYSKVMREFGVEKMPKLAGAFQNNVLFRRGVIFAQRDFNRIVDAVKGKKKFVMMTGLMPTGKFHIGHMIVASQMIFYQKLGAKIYIAVADVEAYHARGQSLEESRNIAFEQYIKNYIAMGLKPKNCEIYFQSARSKDAEKSNAFYLLQNLLSKYATFNEMKAVYGDISPGKMTSALMQSADMLSPQLSEFEGICPVVIPVGIDQDPHLRFTRGISRRMKEYKFTQLSSTYNLFVPGLRGGKMSASNPISYVSMTDSAKEVENKIKKYAFSGGQKSLDEHRKKGGNPDIDVCYQYLQMFFEEHDDKLKKIYDDYKSGKMLTSELKEYTIKKINSFLKGHQVRLRKISKKDIEKFFK